MGDTAPVVVLTRGPLVESRHLVSAAICDPAGRLVAWAGWPGLVTFMRSAAKPVLALALVETGAAAHFGLTDEEIAVTCASHTGEDVHVSAVRSVLAKAGIPEEALQCGVEAPSDRESARSLAARGLEPTEVHCNCSGKHAGMLAVCAHMNWPLEGYWRLEHPLQGLLLANVAMMAGLPERNIAIGVDGCGVPVHGMPLTGMATAFARLASPSGLPPAKASAAHVIVRAMQDHPRLVAGRGRFNTDLLTVMRPRLVAKSGAEAVFCAGLLDRGLGLALKVEDGRSRAVAPAVIELLSQLGAVDPESLAALEPWTRPPNRNLPGEQVGELTAWLTLQRATLNS